MAIVAYAWYARRSAANMTTAWDEFYDAFAQGSPEKLEDVAKDHEGTPVAYWAATVAGDMRLATGCDALFVNKLTGASELRDAENLYRSVRDDRSSPPMLRDRATYGLGRALESQAKNPADIKKAVEVYQQVTGAFAAAAAKRVADLEEQSTQEFYVAFAKFDPKPSLPNFPGQSGDRLPFELDSIPEGGSLFDSGNSFLDLEEKEPGERQPLEIIMPGSEPDAGDSDASDADAGDADASEPDAGDADASEPATDSP